MSYILSLLVPGFFLTSLSSSLSDFMTSCAWPVGASFLNTSLKYLDTCLNVNWIASYLRCSNT